MNCEAPKRGLTKQIHRTRRYRLCFKPDATSAGSVICDVGRFCACSQTWVVYSQDINTVHEIENAVSKLSRLELLAFRDWFSEFDAAAWDKQFEQDVAAGHLDALAAEAICDLREGRCRDL